MNMYLTHSHRGTPEGFDAPLALQATFDHRPLSGDESDRLVREPMQVAAVAYRRMGLAPHVLAESLNESTKGASQWPSRALLRSARVGP
jgi:hypothetical protein